MPVEHLRRHTVVAVSEDRRIHNDFLARDAPNRMIARVNLRGHILNHDALAAIDRLHGNQFEIRGITKAKTQHPGT